MFQCFNEFVSGMFVAKREHAVVIFLLLVQQHTGLLYSLLNGRVCGPAGKGHWPRK